MATNKLKPLKDGKEEPPTKRPWLVMLYMSADAANLQAPLLSEMKELLRPIRERKGQESLYVVAQVETAGGVLKRYDLSTGRARWVATGDIAGFEDFVAFARALGPAEQEALVFWGHSAGVGNVMQAPRLPGEVAADVRQRMGMPDSFLGSIGMTIIDPLPPKPPVIQPAPHVPLPEDPAACDRPEMKPVDILGFDSCYLASAEVTLQFCPYGRLMLASENSISLTGWQFDVMVEAILADPKVKAQALAETMVRAVGITRNSPFTLSLFDLSGAPKVAECLERLVHRLTEALDGKAPGRPSVLPFEARLWVIDAFHQALSTKVRQFLDLPDLCRRLAAVGPGREVRQAARALLTELGVMLVDSVDITGTSLGGISIYCPWPRATEGEVYQGARNVEMDPHRYPAYELSRRTGWSRILARPELVLDAERRAAREQAREYAYRARPHAARGTAARAWAAKPIEMDMKPIEMEEMKPIEMDVRPILSEIRAGI
jgi:Clostripain family